MVLDSEQTAPAKEAEAVRQEASARIAGPIAVAVLKDGGKGEDGSGEEDRPCDEPDEVEVRKADDEVVVPKMHGAAEAEVMDASRRHSFLSAERLARKTNARN